MMERPLSQLKKYRTRFAWVFAISLVILLVSVYFLLAGPAPAVGSGPSDVPMLQSSSTGLPTLISIASLLTSTTSLIGFVLTWAVAWRKERREQQQSDLDIERKKLELEKLRLEIEGKKDKPPSAA